AIDLAIDFQGLLKSAVVIMFARAKQSVGLSSSAARESLASLFYEKRITPGSQHIVNRNLELSNAAGALAPRIAFPIPPFPIPQGRPEGLLSEGPFVLANPLAGWTSKQWPLEHYAVIAARLKSRGFQLVLNGAAAVDVPAAISHISGLPGLIHATRRAHAVIGVDSGPLHLAAALGKPGVAIFGPTDPARNGPYGGTITTLRDPSAITSYKRGIAIDPAMRAVTPDDVWDKLEPLL
ncbi:MAG: glycosyltransferase family 9 protein, partial [Bryobacteraceae bacterium]|nr:glycosyltransferase family 9 protein [Bryobacteraceae bacterium]